MKRIFIGSSKESLEIAENLAAVLETYDGVEVRIWDSVFNISNTTLEDLTSTVHDYSGAVFVFAGDDTVISRGKEMEAPRDNVIFEYGLFSGAIGQKRVAFVRTNNTKIMSDISVTYIPYKNNSFDGSRASIRRWVNSLPDVLTVDDYEFTHRIYAAQNAEMAFEYISLNDCIFTDVFDAEIKCDRLRCIDASYSWVYGGDVKVTPVNPKDEIIAERKENRNTRYFLYFKNALQHGDVHHTGFRFEIRNSQDISTCHLNFDTEYPRETPMNLKVKIPDNMEFVKAEASLRENNYNIFPCSSQSVLIPGCKTIEYGKNIMLKKNQGISLEWTVKYKDNIVK